MNVLAPGATSTPGWHDLAPTAEQHDRIVAEVRSTTPLGHLATSEEIARAALFLASCESSFMTGSELFVDGGSAQI